MNPIFQLCPAECHDIFGGGKGAPPPTVIKPPVMPDTNDPAIIAAKKKQMETMASQTGRASTILSQGGSGSKFGA